MIADRTDIKFACSKCGQHIIIHKAGAGLVANCPICENPVTVPHISSINDRDYGIETRTPGSGNDGHDSDRHPYADLGPEQIRDELFDATVENGRLERELDEARAETSRVQALFKKAGDECERLTANTTHAHAELKSFQSDRQQLKGDLAQAKQRALAAENKLVEERSKANELAAALAAASSENVALRERIEGDLTISRDRLSATETQLEIRERELREARFEAAELVQGLATGQTELSTLRAEAAGLRREIESAHHLLDEAAQAAQRLQAIEKELRRQLKINVDDHKTVCAERDRANAEVERLRRDVSQMDTGRELLELRDRLPLIEEERKQAAAALAEQMAEAKVLAETERKLLLDLHETVRMREDAERRAEAASEHELQKDNEVLRGIIERQNDTLRTHHIESRRFRRSRQAVRVLYLLFGLGLIGLAFFAVIVFAPHGFGGLFGHRP